MEYIIETENLIKQYGTDTVVDNINIHVPKGKVYALLGRNRAGKTTAMKMMLQLVCPTAGTILRLWLLEVGSLQSKIWRYISVDSHIPFSKRENGKYRILSLISDWNYHLGIR